MAKKFKWLPKRHYNDITLLILRVFSGGLMLTHGIPKFTKALNGNTKFADPLAIGAELSLFLTVFAEVFCAGLVVLGLFTRFAVLPLIATMVVAIFVIHIHDPFSQKELATFYLMLYVIILMKGPGKISIDQLVFSK